MDVVKISNTGPWLSKSGHHLSYGADAPKHGKPSGEDENEAR